jgi:ADP-ribose pyrophosphatase
MAQEEDDSFPTENWKIINRHQVLDGSPWIRVFRETLKLPNGSLVDDFYTVETHDFVVVVAFPTEDRMLLLRQYRHGPHEVVFNFPAGFIANGESPLAAARRELLEETGFSGGEWESLGSFVVDGNRGNGKAHFFLAHDVAQVQEACSGDLEEQEIWLIAPSEFYQAVCDNRVKTLPTTCAFLLVWSKLIQEGAL